MLQNFCSMLAISVLLTLSWPGEASAQADSQGTVEFDISYVPGGGHKQQLDLYTPTNTDFPTILFVHGGSLTSGDRKDEPYGRMCEVFQEIGIACAAMSYRLAREHKWPDQPDDVVAAFKWLKRNIGPRGGDPERIFLFGHSSGCTLVAIVAADGRYLEAQDLDVRDVAGVIPMGCRLNDYTEITETRPPWYEQSWVPPEHVEDYMKREAAFVSMEQHNDAVPATHVSEALPPTLVLIAEAERFFPPILRDAAEFVGRALVADAEADIVILDDRRHVTAIRMMVAPDDPAVARIVEFVRAH